MAKLLVKLDHVATLREARRARTPDPVFAAAIAEVAGASGVVLHLRSDRRHIKERDLELLRQTIKTHLTIEVSPTQEMLRLVRQIKPERVVLVPERAGEITTESGLDVVRNREMLSKELPMLAESGIQLGLFIDPDVDQVKAAHKLNVEVVQLNMARYADARTEVARFQQWNNITTAANAAHKFHLVVSAAHDVSYQHAQDLKNIKDIDEFVVGFAIITRALQLGMDRAVREMVDIVK